MDETTNTAVETAVEATTEAAIDTTPQVGSAETEAKTDPAIEKLQKQLAEKDKQLAQVTKERDGFKKDLRKSKSAEEQRLDEALEKQEQMQAELENYKKQAAISSHSKKVFAFVGNEDISNTVAEYLMGAADADGVIDEIAKAWKAKETQLRKELGKTPIGGTSEEEVKRNKAVDYAHKIGKAKVNNMQSGNNPLSRFII